MQHLVCHIGLVSALASMALRPPRTCLAVELVRQRPLVQADNHQTVLYEFQVLTVLFICVRM